MEFIGTSLTAEDKERILCPYSTNKGEDWSLDLLVEYIEHGDKIISENEQLRDNIKAGLNMLRHKST